jgi:hypothetical protein
MPGAAYLLQRALRDAIGVDISAIAEFVATVKTTVFSEAELDRLEAWAKRVPATIDIHKPSGSFADYAALGYYKHLDHPSRWRLRKAIEQALGSAIRLPNRRLEAFARCTVLRAGQWALDGRANLPTTLANAVGSPAALGAEIAPVRFPP